MPWTIADVDKHRKGLTLAQKKHWVEIANAVLADARASEPGSDESYCVALAIRVANSKFKKGTK